MKKAIFVLSVLAFTACGKTPTEPQTITGEFSPMPASAFHNIPATMPDGTVVYVCETQPRQYSSGMERDHYIAFTACPAVPIR
jgi:hypothetical protein